LSSPQVAVFLPVALLSSDLPARSGVRVNDARRGRCFEFRGGLKTLSLSSAVLASRAGIRQVADDPGTSPGFNICPEAIGSDPRHTPPCPAAAFPKAFSIS
jgi:hypothetical protein